MYRPPGDHVGSCSSPGIGGSGVICSVSEVHQEEVEVTAVADACERELGPVGRDRRVEVVERRPT